MRKITFVLLTLATLAGCSSSKINVASTNTDLLRVGEEPQGYPAIYIEKANGYCVQVTDSWSESSYSGTKIWLKQSRRASVACP